MAEGSSTPEPPRVSRAAPSSLPATSPFQAATGSARKVLMDESHINIPLAWLGVVSGPGAARGQTFVLSPETIIGRTVGDVLLSGDRTVSSQHAKVRLEPKESGAGSESVFVIYDLASANGTYVGRREHLDDDANRIYRRELHNGDYVLLGETTLVFWQA